jgi:RNA recognition motif-containing protein
VDSIWSLPSDDVIGELSKETRAIYVKNINVNTTVTALRKTFGNFGKILKIKRFSTKAFVVYDNHFSAKKAME